MSIKCFQCDNPAVYDTKIGHLCLHCYHKIQQVEISQREEIERMLNYLRDQMDWTIGINTGSPRFPERKPPIIQNSPINYSPIIIDKSIVGSVNTGYISKLEVSMSSIKQKNGNEADKIKKFTEEVLKEKDLQKKDKEEIIQQLEYLTNQLMLAEEKRNQSVISVVVSRVASLVNFSASLITLWNPIKNLFG